MCFFIFIISFQPLCRPAFCWNPQLLTLLIFASASDIMEKAPTFCWERPWWARKKNAGDSPLIHTGCFMTASLLHGFWMFLKYSPHNWEAFHTRHITLNNALWQWQHHRTGRTSDSEAPIQKLVLGWVQECMNWMNMFISVYLQIWPVQNVMNPWYNETANHATLLKCENLSESFRNISKKLPTM